MRIYPLNTNDCRKNNNQAFSIIELVVIIGVFSILISFLFPAVKNAMKRARLVKDGNALRQLVLAYKKYSMNKGRNVSITDIEVWSENDMYLMQGLAAVLAEENILIDAAVYYSPNDFRYKNALSGVNGYRAMMPPKIILKKNGDFDNKFYEFGTSSGNIFPLVVEGFIGISDNAPQSTTPIFFTRGAGVGGWGKNSPYGVNEGGFVAFLDGNVRWFDDFGDTKKNGKFVKFGTSERTNDIAEAVPAGVIWLESPGVGSAQ